MLLHEQQVRLTERERAILYRLTGSDPCHITTRQQLKEWADCYLQSFPDEGMEIQLIKKVLRLHLPI